jgi:hypothetical protein
MTAVIFLSLASVHVGSLWTPPKPTQGCSQWLWFVGLHEGHNAGECGAGDGYYAQYSAALASAQHYAATVLVPVLLLGRFGLANSSQLSPFGRWATSKGVVVFPVARLDFQDDLVRALPHTTGNDHLMGPYLRLHIVSIMRDHPELLLSQRPNICADHVLYTDSDVLFVHPVHANDLLHVINARATGMSAHEVAAPAAVLYGPESNRHARSPENTGVMFMNVPRFQRLFPVLLAFGRERNFSFPAYDQGWLNAFFTEKMPTGRSMLDAHWNWKVYWGKWKDLPESDSSGQPRLKHSPYILHFHGPKPGRGNFLECLASMNDACLAELSRKHPYWTLCNNGFRADGGLLANSTLRAYQRFSADCHEWG